MVTDMDYNCVVWCHKGHDQETFASFCELLTPAQRRKVRIVAGDGARWIDACTSKYFPNAERCVDPFHVVGWINEALDQVRKDMVNAARRDFSTKRLALTKLERELAEKLIAINDELGKMPVRGRPSNRKLELLAMKKEIEDMQLGTVKLDGVNKGKGVGRNGDGSVAFSPEHQAELDRLHKMYEDLKGAGYAPRKNPEHLTDNQQAKLSLITAEYPELFQAYVLKEQLRIVVHMSDPELAAARTGQVAGEGRGIRTLAVC